MFKAAIFASSAATVDRVYGKGRREEIAKRVELYDTVITEENIRNHLANLKDIDAIFGTWFVPGLTAQRLDAMPKLRAIFYAGSGTRYFAAPLFPRGIRLMSAREVNARPVAEFAVAQIILSCKGYFRNMRESKSYEGRMRNKPFAGKGNFHQEIGIIGFGAAGRQAVELLKHYDHTIVVYDPYLAEDLARKFGVARATLEEIFARCYVVSNHAPDFGSTKGMLDGKLFASMQPDATFINTGRGATVNENELIAVLKERKDLTALLDVTFPEPPEKDSAFYSLENVYLTDHLAGSSGDEVIRMADCCIASFDEWRRSGDMPHEITGEIFSTLAP